MGPNEEYEIMAEAFYIMTGYMAPGKDVASGAYSEPYEFRVGAWKEWRTENGKCIEAMLTAFERNK